jgi:glycosyltransferase involved in cell wall biosynthesis
MKKTTITVSLPAFNVEQNIEELLLAILNQKLSKFELKEIIVYSDASTDKTDEKVKAMTKVSSKIKLVTGKTRKGKYYRMNELFAMCKTDILIIMDADVAMVGNSFINKLANGLVSDKNALAVSARNIFVRPEGFVARILHRHYTIWDNILLSLLSSDSPSQFSGTATAFRGVYARQLSIPTSVQNPHLYLYLAARSKNGFRYCMDAQIRQYVPSNMHEVKTVLVRKIMQPDKKLDNLFGENTIRSLQVIPKKIKLQAVIKSFFEDPFYTPLAICMTLYIGRISRHLGKNTTQLWEINNTTKKKITYEK